MEDVKKSGYFFMLCKNIADAWRICDPKRPKVEDSIIPSYLDCKKFEEKDDEDAETQTEQCHEINGIYENKCRNNVLFYYAGMYNSEIVWEGLATLDEYKSWLIEQCSTISVVHENEPFFPLVVGEEDDLQEVLEGDQKIPAYDWKEIDDEEKW